MSANRELDQLLHRLRQDPLTCALDGVEERVWQRIAGRESRIQRAGMGLPFLLASVVAAFVWGIFSGGLAAPARSFSPPLLVEEMDVLPPEPGSLLP